MNEDVEFVEAQDGKESAKSQNPNEYSGQGEKIEVERFRLYSVMIYDVTETELNLLEKGTDSSVWLNFFIGTLSVAISFIISLLTVSWENNDLLKIIFVCVSIIMGFAALLCFVFWLKGRGERNATIKIIRSRKDK